MSHLRDVKDPLLAANAARLLPDRSRVRVVHAGRALSSDWEQAAREEERKNPRYEWLGDLPHEEAMYLLSGSRYLVLSSLMEGGASVIAEAVACGIPVLCSKIPGNIGMLGADYWGYFSPRGQILWIGGDCLLERLERGRQLALLEHLRAAVLVAAGVHPRGISRAT